MASPWRLLWHSLGALAVFFSMIVGPMVLLLRLELGVYATYGGLVLLAVGCSSLLGAILVKMVDYNSCTALQWRCIVLACWVFNPVTTVWVAVKTNNREVACWSGIPFGIVLALLSARLQLLDGDPAWHEESCSVSQLIKWFLSRSVCVAVPVFVLSFQVTLYLPEASLLPQGAEVGLFVCGGCILISAKFCAMCAALAQQKLPQAMQMVLLLSADWISALHLLALVRDEVKSVLLLSHFMLIGLIQMRVSLRRLHLCSRYRRALARRRSAREARLAAIADPDSVQAQLRALEAGLQVNQHGSESSDSDDEDGPGSLPSGFHDTLLALIGIAPREVPNRRQFLCPARQAVVASELAAGVSLQSPLTASGDDVGSREADDALSSADLSVASEVTDGAEAEPSEATPSTASLTSLEISVETKCTVCLEVIKTGERIRPLPKCSHVFHADCLDAWAKRQREKTRCPVCRQPALAKRAAEGTISIASLNSDSSTTSSATPSASSRRGSGSGRSGSSRGGRGAGNRSNSRGSNASSPAPPVRVTPEMVARLQFLGCSEMLVRVALEISNGSDDAAANLLFSHRDVLEALGPRAAEERRYPSPTGLAEALVQANPNLAEVQTQLRCQLSKLSKERRLGLPSNYRGWDDPRLDESTRIEVFRAVLTDVGRRQEQAAPRR